MKDDKQQTMLKLFSEYRNELSAQKNLGWLDRESKRNMDHIDLYEAMIREAYENVTMVVAGHHIMFTCAGRLTPYEVASADTLIFDHFIAERIWKDAWKDVLAALATEPASTRDDLLRKLYLERK